MTQVGNPNLPNTVECSAADAFGQWLSQSGGSLAITTYQAGKVALVGWDGNQLTLLMREFDKPLGMAVSGNRMALATRHQIIQFANSPLLADEYLENQTGRYNALYLPRISHYTGDLHTHDLAYDKDGLVVVNTRFSCLSRLSSDYSFEPFWRPKFVTDVVPEDRCHLNGVALVNGQAKYVTVLGMTDEAGTWRENKASGGVILDVDSQEVVSADYAMPHSPRWYQNNLWVLNSGAGELCLVDTKTGKRAVVCRLPGYLRGLSFVGPFAIIGLSKIREKHIFGGLPVQTRYPQLMCGVAIVNILNGNVVGMFEFTSGCSELYDVQFLAGASRPMMLNTDKEAIRQAVTNPDSSYWLRPSKEIKDDAPTSGMSATGMPTVAPQDTRAEAALD